MKHLIFLLTLIFISNVAYGQEMPKTSMVTGAVISPTIWIGTEGECFCSANAKTWPCRRVIDYSKTMTCYAVSMPRLSCPDDRTQPCIFANSPTCSTPPETSMCYAGDEPK